MLDRTIAPPSAPFLHIPLPKVEKDNLSNGIPVYLLPYGSVEVIEIQAIFKGGINYQSKSGIASYCLQNMVEATQTHNSLELAQILDGYGAWLGQQAEEDCLSFSLATLSKNLVNTLSLLREVITEPAFSEEEFKTMKTRTLQKMNVAEQKTSNKAVRNFRKYMFGESHPYGFTFGSQELKNIEIAELISFYHTYIRTANLSFLITGNFDRDQCFQLLEKEFGHLEVKGEATLPKQLADSHPQLGRFKHEQEGMQSSLRLGHKGISRTHEDYYGMQVVNTILGGYFGSRLMHNIREEKGYTYGIYSGWLGMKYDGFFIVQTDVGNEYAEATIQEIKNEMRLLTEGGVSEPELELVKNYMLGQGISRRETPFQLGDILRFSLSQEISFEEIDRKFEVISQIQAEEIQALAGKYLQPHNMLEVVVGLPS